MTTLVSTDTVFTFSDLASLADEFYHIPISIFPFKNLKKEEIWREYGITTKEYCDPIQRYLVKGNFISARIRREARLKIEVILEIFHHVHPTDLLSLIRTTKTLRNLLLSKGSLSVWQSAFAANEEVPLVPQGTSPPKWATMLFGPPTCDGCGVYPAMVDFTYNDKLCQSCSPPLYSYDEAEQVLRSINMVTKVETYVRGTPKKDPLRTLIHSKLVLRSTSRVSGQAFLLPVRPTRNFLSCKGGFLRTYRRLREHTLIGHQSAATIVLATTSHYNGR
ncbi:hypothetical protein BJ165DRAFT_11392 [Panaeolus papilionaceus]|nr:hypothetical protein BJ165DRAFT_11392 [Panaeolus papilionaceus]